LIYWLMEIAKRYVATLGRLRCACNYFKWYFRQYLTSQDVKTLKTTPNPAPLSISTADGERPHFVRPPTLKEMNGVRPFIDAYTCGDVFSLTDLKTVLSSSLSASPPGLGGLSSDPNTCKSVLWQPPCSRPQCHQI
jgi:hypothetical protein